MVTVEPQISQVCLGRLDSFQERLHTFFNRGNNIFSARSVITQSVLGQGRSEAGKHAIVVHYQAKILARIDSVCACNGWKVPMIAIKLEAAERAIAELLDAVRRLVDD